MILLWEADRVRKIYLLKPTADKNIFYLVKVTNAEQLDDPEAIIGVLLTHDETLATYNVRLHIARMAVDGDFSQPLIIIKRGQLNQESFWNLIKEGSFELLRQFAI